MLVNKSRTLWRVYNELMDALRKAVGDIKKEEFDRAPQDRLETYHKQGKALLAKFTKKHPWLKHYQFVARLHKGAIHYTIECKPRDTSLVKLDYCKIATIVGKFWDTKYGMWHSHNRRTGHGLIDKSLCILGPVEGINKCSVRTIVGSAKESQPVSTSNSKQMTTKAKEPAVGSATQKDSLPMLQDKQILEYFGVSQETIQASKK